MKYIVYLFMLVFVTGCSEMQVAPEEAIVKPAKPAVPVNWPRIKKQRQAIKSWELRGHLGIQTADNGGSLDLDWRQDDDDYVIRLLAPLGQGSYLISGDSHSATIRMPDGKIRVVDNPDLMFKSVLGVQLPISALRDWVRGLPAASLPLTDIRWNKQGLLHIVDQAGWHVEMVHNLGDKIRLPYKFYLTREDRPELDIRLALRQWMIDN